MSSHCGDIIKKLGSTALSIFLGGGRQWTVFLLLSCDPQTLFFLLHSWGGKLYLPLPHFALNYAQEMYKALSLKIRKCSLVYFKETNVAPIRNTFHFANFLSFCWGVIMSVFPPLIMCGRSYYRPCYNGGRRRKRGVRERMRDNGVGRKMGVFSLPPPTIHKKRVCVGINTTKTAIILSIFPGNRAFVSKKEN